MNRITMRTWLPLLAAATLTVACRDETPTVGVTPAPALGSESSGQQSSDWQQCANNGRDVSVPATVPCEWINSVLNAGKATYSEDESIPFRFAVHLVDVNSKGQPLPTFDTNKERFVTFTYGFTKANHGNYDFLTRFDVTEGSPADAGTGLSGVGGAQRADLCASDFAPVVPLYCDGGDLRAAFANAHHSMTIPDAVFTMNAPTGTGTPDNFKSVLLTALARHTAKYGAQARRIDIFGGTITGFDNVTYKTGQEVLATFTVKFKANQPDVLLAFGAHFSYVADWNDITDKNGVAYSGGAGQSGSPFHIKVDNIDGTGVGALGNNVSGAVLVTNPGVSISKTPSVTDVCTSGSTVTYSYVVTNTGDVPLSGTVTDDKLGAIGTFTNLAPGASQTFTKSTSISSTTTNVATVTATDGADATVTATATSTVAAHPCSISLTKSPSVSSVCSGAGTSVTYTYVVTNTGDFFNASGTLVDDAGTPGNTADDVSVGSWGPLAPGASATMTASATINATTTNTATASGTTGGTSVTATASATVTAAACRISLTKTPDIANVCTGSNTTVTYTYVVTNDGGFSASGSLTDDNGTPGNTADDVSVGSWGPLAPGASATLTKAFTLTGSRTNIATASGTSGGSTVQATATATVTGRACSISLTKTPSVTQVCTGASTQVTYTYVVTNTGDFFNASGSLTDNVLGSIGSWGPLAPGATQTLTKTATVNATTTNVGTATGTTGPSGSVSVSATATATVTAAPCGRAQLTPTGTECSAFKAGTATTQAFLDAHRDGNKIGPVNPGVFIAWFEVDLPAGASAINVLQTQSPDSPNFPDFAVNGTEAWIYNASCVKVHDFSTISGGQASTSFTAPAAGKYIIRVKYDPSTVTGLPLYNDLPETYSFAAQLGGVTQIDASLILRKKP